MALKSWLIDRGAFVHSCLDLVRCLRNDGDHGCFATSFIGAGEVLLRVPTIMCIEADSLIALALKLIKLLKTSSNNWEPYLSTLPLNAFENFLGEWTNDERSLLIGTSIDIDIEKEWVGTILNESIETSTDEAKRALRLVLSRAVELSNRKWLIAPGIDALNHAHPSYTNAQLYITNDDSILELVCTKDIESNEEIKHNYDEYLTPALALQRYGILSGLEDTSAWAPSAVLVDVSTLLPVGSLPRYIALKLRLIPQQHNFVLALTLQDPLPETLIGVVLLKNLKNFEDDLNHLQNLGPNQADFVGSLAIAPNDIFTAVFLDLRHLLESRLATFFTGRPPPPSTIKTADRIKAALAVRDHEKAPLLAALEILKDTFHFQNYLLEQSDN